MLLVTFTQYVTHVHNLSSNISKPRIFSNCQIAERVVQSPQHQEKLKHGCCQCKHLKFANQMKTIVNMTESVRDIVNNQFM